MSQNEKRDNLNYCQLTSSILATRLYVSTTYIKNESLGRWRQPYPCMSVTIV
jgi:hypothetical protein